MPPRFVIAEPEIIRAPKLNDIDRRLTDVEQNGGGGSSLTIDGGNATSNGASSMTINGGSA